MNLDEIKIFDSAPFFFWVKNKAGVYLWGNQTICRFAGEDVAGKTDYVLVWSENADALVAADKQVFETGRPITLEEFVDNSSQGKGDYYFNVCKWLNDIDGHPCCLGLSFIVEK